MYNENYGYYLACVAAFPVPPPGFLIVSELRTRNDVERPREKWRE